MFVRQRRSATGLRKYGLALAGMVARGFSSGFTRRNGFYIVGSVL